MKKTFIFLSVLLFLSSCETKEYSYIPKDKKPALNNNDTIYFVNHKDNSLVDTFVTSLWHDFDVSDKRYYTEFIRVRYRNTNKNAYINDFSAEYYVASINIFAGSYPFPNFKYSGKNRISLDVDNITYRSVSVIERHSFPDTIPNIIYFSCKEGILRYDYSNTDYYEKKRN